VVHIPPAGSKVGRRCWVNLAGTNNPNVTITYSLLLSRVQMGKWIRDKHSAGCAMCKPWKHGWDCKYNDKERAYRIRTDKEMREVLKYRK